MRVVKQSTARNVMVFMADSSDHITGKTGLGVGVEISKNGGVFNAQVGISVIERGNGWYSVGFTAAQTDTLGDLAVRCVAAGADTSDFIMQVVAYDFGDAAALGLSRLDAAISSRLATAGYTAPANSDVAAIKAKTDNLPADPASNTQINTRLAAADYTAPDNLSIAAIKSKTDELPADPASHSSMVAAFGDVNTALENLDSSVNNQYSDLDGDIQAIADTLGIPVAGSLAADITELGVKIDGVGDSVSNIPTNPVQDDDSRLDYLDAPISEAGGGDSAPTASDVANAVWTKTIEPFLSVPGGVADALFVAATRALPSEPDNAGIAAIKTKTDALPADPASNTQVNTRLASSSYTAPDNAGIAAVKAKTDILPTNPLLSNDERLDYLDAPVSGAGGGGGSVDLSPVQTVVNAIKAKTDNLPTEPLSRGEFDYSMTLMGGYLDAINNKTTNLPDDPASNTQVNTRLAATDYVAPANSNIAAIKAKTDTLTVTDGNIHADAKLVSDKTGYGLADSQIDVKKNQALNNFQFPMTDNEDHLPAEGLSVSASRLIDGGTWVACTNAVTEIGRGMYKINLTAAELNGKVITLQFSAAGADTLPVTIVTQG